MTYMCSSGVQPGGMINKPGESIFYFILQTISGGENTDQFSLLKTQEKQYEKKFKGLYRQSREQFP